MLGLPQQLEEMCSAFFGSASVPLLLPAYAELIREMVGWLLFFLIIYIKII
jgi:hypothetical protein